MPQAKTEIALQFLECCAAETALQHSLFCSADVICTKSCAAANEKLHCNIEIAALQESGAVLPLSCWFQAPTFRHPRFGLAEPCDKFLTRPLSTGAPLAVRWHKKIKCLALKVIVSYSVSEVGFYKSSRRIPFKTSKKWSFEVIYMFWGYFEPFRVILKKKKRPWKILWPKGRPTFELLFRYPAGRWDYTGDLQTVICKPCSENSWTKGWKWGVQSRSARNSLKSPFSNHH